MGQSAESYQTMGQSRQETKYTMLHKRGHRVSQVSHRPEHTAAL